jgi:hypothetical protein
MFCPDCYAEWDIANEDACPHCRLSLEDLEAAGDFLDRWRAAHKPAGEVMPAE